MSRQQPDLDELRVTTLRFPASQYERLREIAEANHRTVSQEMRSLIAQAIAEADERDAKQAAA